MKTFNVTSDSDSMFTHLVAMYVEVLTILSGKDQTTADHIT